VNVNIISETLINTFADSKNIIPFRIIIAGGDDLCIVMPEMDIIDFAKNLSCELDKQFNDLKNSHPLTETWLKKTRNELEEQGLELAIQDENIKPYSFGSSFVVTPLHTPFSKIHEVGEELMTIAKQKTVIIIDNKQLNRMGNSINWRIMAEENAITDQLINFEKPLFIEKNTTSNDDDPLSFREYIDLLEDLSEISSSHKHQIISKMIEYQNDPVQIERWLMCHASAELEKSFSGILEKKELRTNKRLDGEIIPKRIATLLELMSIKRG